MAGRLSPLRPGSPGSGALARLNWPLAQRYLPPALDLLALTNWERFGRPMEFGHALNFSDPVMVYSTRFDNPFKREPTGPAAKELVGALFGQIKFNQFRWYQPDIFPGQSTTPRWREFYFPNFGWSIAFIILCAWSWGVIGLTDTKRIASGSALSGLSAAFSALPSVPLFAFYMHSPGLTSRYLLDFGAAFAVAAAGLWIRASSVAERRVRPSLAKYWPCLPLALWIGHEIWTAPVEPQHVSREPQVYRDEVSFLKRPMDPAKLLPLEYKAGQNPAEYGIFGNGLGWDLQTGEAWPCVLLFVDAPESVTVEMSPRPGVRVTPEYIAAIRAKVGLEELTRRSLTTNDNVIRITFQGPLEPEYQQGVQTLFLAMMPPNRLGRDEVSGLLLRRIAWTRFAP